MKSLPEAGVDGTLKKRKISQNICENNDIIYATGGY